ncbi:MAG: hypothetical protein WCQ57_14830 [Verrucomicrobiota bacterium]
MENQIPCVPSRSVGPAPAFQARERWCAAGDSLTQSGLYHQFVHLF